MQDYILQSNRQKTTCFYKVVRRFKTIAKNCVLIRYIRSPPDQSQEIFSSRNTKNTPQGASIYSLTLCERGLIPHRWNTQRHVYYNMCVWWNKDKKSRQSAGWLFTAFWWFFIWFFMVIFVVHFRTIFAFAFFFVVWHFIFPLFICYKVPGQDIFYRIMVELTIRVFSQFYIKKSICNFCGFV